NHFFSLGECGPPPKVKNARPTETVHTKYPIRTIIYYKCFPGFAKDPKKSNAVACLASHEWSYPEKFCIEKRCPHPGEILNGHIEIESLRAGSVIHFTCDKGHKLFGSSTSTCRTVKNESRWSDPLPLCKAIFCPPPPDVTDGKWTSTDRATFSFGTRVTYSCSDGLFLIGHETLHCSAEGDVGKWNRGAPECREVSCPSPEIPNGHKLPPAAPPYSYRDTIHISCDYGFVISGEEKVYCGANSTWVPEVPQCKRATCEIPVIPYAHAVASSSPNPPYSYADTMSINCDPGFTMVGNGNISCGLSGLWLPDLPYCRGSCEEPTRLTFAIPKPEYQGQARFDVGATVDYTCRPGYRRTPSLSPRITCLASGTWSKPPSFCQPKPCPNPEDLLNGRIEIEDIVFGSTIFFRCNNGH
uniref:Sushi domain-containing protein n=1 Tax=Ornithorhynchus anatinus TaxID=9258 RepID=A0A6I8NVF4_ORNAN